MFFEDMILPFGNENEDLETVSGNYFRLLFDVSRFEIRAETVRDKGIDFHIELKRVDADGRSAYLNFRFVVQLKATDVLEPGRDGSIAMQMYTSNINYLLNNGMPAYYVLFQNSSKTFYFESINDFARRLYAKDTDWDKQATHTYALALYLTVLALIKSINIP